MPQVFTVRWPIFARLEAVLLFPVTLFLGGQIPAVRGLVDGVIVPALSPLQTRFGISDWIAWWIAVGLVVVIPYGTAVLMVDRILTLRKGYALLSLAAIALWAIAAMLLTHQMPGKLAAGGDWLTPDKKAALVTGGVALLLHAVALWTGLRDEGEVAARLIAAREDDFYRRIRADDPRHAQDLYFRQTAQFRTWQGQKQLEGLNVEPRETAAVKALSAITWIGVAIGAGVAYHNWSDYTAFKTAATSDNASNRPVVEHAPGPSLTGPAMPLTPLSQPPENLHSVSIPQLPAVQRPTDISSSIQAAGISIGANEAIAERGNDGGFAFDAIVNGSHVTMLFDTGATVVTLRAEDAVRFGINLGRLNFSAKVKTANGTADVAPVLIDTLTIGNITQHGVPAFVAKQGMLQVNLLGQTFLTRLAGYNVDKNLLVLKGR